jgi:hypothetical protein
MKNAYLAPAAEFLCVSTDTDILFLSQEYGPEIPLSEDGDATL